MHLLTTATEITQTGYNYYKCMNELAENIVTKIYFQQEKTVLIVLKNYTNQYYFVVMILDWGKFFLPVVVVVRWGGFYFIQQTLLICN